MSTYIPRKQKYKKYAEDMFYLLNEYWEERLFQRIRWECYVEYAAYETDSKGVPINNIDDIAVRGTVRFERYGYKSKPIKNPTWLDIAVLANDSILYSDDIMHVYFEKIEKIKNKKNTYHIHMGS